ncbi:hypothetical protein D3C71_1476930 [compost metagenome]
MEQHREHNQEIDQIPSVQISSGEAVSHQRRDEHTEQGTDQRNSNGYTQCFKNRIRGKNKLICFKAPHFRDQYKFTRCDFRTGREGACHHMHKWQHRHERNEGQQCKVNHSKNSAAYGSVFYHFRFLPQSLNKRLLRPFFWTVC